MYPLHCIHNSFPDKMNPAYNEFFFRAIRYYEVIVYLPILVTVHHQFSHDFTKTGSCKLDLRGQVGLACSLPVTELLLLYVQCKAHTFYLLER